MVPLGIFKVPHRFQSKIPNAPALKDVDFYFQGISLDGNNNVHVSNSCQAWVF